MILRVLGFVLATTVAVASGQNQSITDDFQQQFSPEERAQCQCSVDGFSGGADVMFNEKYTEEFYETENVVTGGPYQFIGCGAHTRYRDENVQQHGGYPWRFCYTYGGNFGCGITETSQKHSLNSDIAHRFCNGYYDCNATARTRVFNGNDGALLQTIVLEEFDEDGYLKDWSNCCKECSLYGPDCKVWDFSVETMECRLFSGISSGGEQAIMTVGDPAQPPMWYSGGPGFDDHPLNCWRRTQYDTCVVRGPRFLLSFGILFPALGSLLLLLIKHCTKDGDRARLGSTNDVTPGYSRTVTRRAGGKGNGTTQVTVHTAGVVCKTRGFTRNLRVERSGQRFQEDKTVYFEYTEDSPRSIKALSCCERSCFGCSLLCPFLFVSAGLTGLLLLCLQVITTDGGLHLAKYVLPGKGRKATWIFFTAFIAVVFLSVASVWCYDLHKRRKIREEDKYDRLRQQKQHETKGTDPEAPEKDTEAPSSATEP